MEKNSLFIQVFLRFSNKLRNQLKKTKNTKNTESALNIMLSAQGFLKQSAAVQLLLMLMVFLVVNLLNLLHSLAFQKKVLLKQNKKFLRLLSLLITHQKHVIYLKSIKVPISFRNPLTSSRLSNKNTDVFLSAIGFRLPTAHQMCRHSVC